MLYESTEFLAFLSVCPHYDNPGSSSCGMLEIAMKVDSRVFYVKIKTKKENISKLGRAQLVSEL